MTNRKQNQLNENSAHTKKIEWFYECTNNENNWIMVQSKRMEHLMAR